MLSFRIGRLYFRLHSGVLLMGAGLFALGGDLWLRYIALVFVLLLHELAHAGMAILLRGSRAIVTLWPWGGVAHVPRFRGRAGAAVAFAGPVVNLVAAGVSALAGGGISFDLGHCSPLDLLLTANLLMGVGNLIPIPPLDGGRILQFLRQSNTSSRGEVS